MRPTVVHSILNPNASKTINCDGSTTVEGTTAAQTGPVPCVHKGVWRKTTGDQDSARTLEGAVSPLDFPPLNPTGGTASDPAEEPLIEVRAARRSRRVRHSRQARDGRTDRLDRAEFGKEAVLAAYALDGVSRADVCKEPLYLRYAAMVRQTGVEEALLELKKSASALRSDWITRSAGNRAGQLSFIGRALPPGNQDVERAALAQHKIDLQTPWESDAKPTLQGELEDFVRRWCKRRVKNSDYVYPPDLPTSSSCFEAKVKAGGLRGSIASTFWDVNAPFPEGRDPVSTEDLSVEYRLLQTGVEAYQDLGPEVSNRVSVVRERGLKVRVVSSSPRAIQILGHLSRKRILAGLRKTTSAAMPLLGLPDEAISDQLRGAACEVLVSTDLTRASDLIPLELAESITRGLESAGKLTALEAQVLRSMFGPQSLLYPDGDKVTSCRGILMGMPSTWCYLSLLHTWWWDKCIRDECAHRGVSYSEGVRRNRFITCGDDALFCGWRAVSDRYSALVQACGGQPSPGKHFITSGQRLRGVFLERLFEVRAECGFLVEVKRLNAVPVRGLVRPEAPLDLAKDYPTLTLPHGLKYLLAVSAAYDSNAACKPRLDAWAVRRAPWLTSYARSLGLLPGIPLRAGGFPLGQPTQQSLRRAAAMIQGEESVGISLLVKRIVDPNWRLAEECIAANDQDWVARGTLRFARADKVPAPLRCADGALRPFRDTGDAKSVILGRVSALYRGFVFQMPRSSLSASVKFASLRRRLLRVFRKVDAQDVKQPASLDEALQPKEGERFFVCRVKGSAMDSYPLRWDAAVLATDAHQRHVHYAGAVVPQGPTV